MPKKISEQIDFLTADKDLFVVDHLGVPIVPSEKKSVSVSGLVEEELSLTSEMLEAFPESQITAFHKCAGNPFFSSEPSPDRTGNVVWSGVRLADVLEKTRPLGEAKYVWITGCDFGSYFEDAPQNYCKDIPLDRAIHSEVLLATKLNGLPLTRERGGPYRLVVPGFYATNSVKWVNAIRLMGERSQSIFTTKYYNDEVSSSPGITRTVPVWAVAPDSAITSPVSGSTISNGEEICVSGWAWGDVEIQKVEVSSDGGSNWHQAEVKPRVDWSWQRFEILLPSLADGKRKLVSRATDKSGNRQPMQGARNASVPVELSVRNA